MTLICCYITPANLMAIQALTGVRLLVTGASPEIRRALQLHGLVSPQVGYAAKVHDALDCFSISSAQIKLFKDPSTLWPSPT
jgi:hypothetical protein